MLENLIFSLGVTMPVFLTMATGFFLHTIGWFDDDFASKVNKFVFKIALPVSVFRQLANADFLSVWDTKFCVFCFTASFVSIVAAYFIGRKMLGRMEGAEFAQAAYRSSQALLGVTYIAQIYGRDSVLTALMIISSVPLYNVMAVLILSGGTDGGSDKKMQLVLKSLKGIITNPIIDGILLGIVWSVFMPKMPVIPDKTLSNIGGLASPLGLLALGASIDLKKAGGRLKPALVASAIKLMGWTTVFLPIAVLAGFREEALATILIMFGAPTTVAGYVMARNYGHDGTLTSNTVMITTLLSSLSLTVWLFILKTFAFI